MKNWYAAILFLLVTTTVTAEPFDLRDLKALPPKDGTHVYGGKLRRTMHLLATSTAERPNKVKIVFFGQSITRQDYSRKIIESDLRRRFPHAQLEVLNTAIGGYSGIRSLRIMEHNLIPHQPDLVVYHVYGGEEDGSYEAVLKAVHHRTTAELLTITHHVDDLGDDVTAKRELASQLRRELAKVYDSELVDLREPWKWYLKTHKLGIRDLLRDGIHLNRAGGELWGRLQLRHFEVQPAQPQDWADRVVRLRPERQSAGIGKVVESKGWRIANGQWIGAAGATLRVAFKGSRVDVMSRSGNGVVDVRIDGRPPSAHSGCWYATLPTPTPIDYRPAIMRVDLAGLPVAETWTVTADPISDDGKTFSYSLLGSASGPQGRGDQSASFRSANGVIRLNPRDFTFDHAVQVKRKPVPSPCTITWRTYTNSLDRWTPGSDRNTNPSGQTTLVQGLPNSDHVLELTVDSGEARIDELILHRPNPL